MSTVAVEVARALIEIGAVGFSPDKPVTFKSGILSPVYVDNRRLPYWPAQWQTVIQGFHKAINDAQIAFDVIAGIETAGIPHSAALAYSLERPSVFVRKQAKDHGTRSRIEGGSVTGKRVLLVEDLVTTGGSSLSGVEALREDGAVVEDCLAIISYGFAEAAEAFAAAEVRLHTLTAFDVVLDQALEMERFGAREHEIITDWQRDPHGWADRQEVAE